MHNLHIGEGVCATGLALDAAAGKKPTHTSILCGEVFHYKLQ